MIMTGLVFINLFHQLFYALQFSSFPFLKIDYFKGKLIENFMEQNSIYFKHFFLLFFFLSILFDFSGKEFLGRYLLYFIFFFLFEKNSSFFIN